MCSCFFGKKTLSPSLTSLSRLHICPVTCCPSCPPICLTTHPPTHTTTHQQILIGKLTAAVLAPTLLGMAIRASHPRVREWIVKYRTPLGLFCTVNLVAIVWQTLSAAHDALIRQTGATLALVALAAILQHFAYLFFNFLVALKIVRLPPPEVVTVVIMGACGGCLCVGDKGWDGCMMMYLYRHTP